ncbi:nudix hydrolase 10-like isoform X2 [Asparagus officinalis]|uniref:nudix hydrolase 10-like isoform X2 n=1 Tax=Asparagus officinalis TaxID=4686 RepID=UPI00098DED44|nr:nudix hydrolase 10-like isoform X2 [Asparagus officinalis]
MIGCRAMMLRFGNASLCLCLNRNLIGSWSRIRSESIRSAVGNPRGFKISGRGQLNNKFSCVSKNSSVVTPESTGKGEVDLLTASDDNHRGVIVEINDPMNPKDFVSSLRASILNWRQQGKRGVWLKLPIKSSNLVQPAVEEGFYYHHAEPSYLMLVYWIPATKNTLPVNATHRVGVGAIVMNDRGEVLAVQERSGKLRGSGVWKFPTGVVDQGEDIFAGAVREVKEETGIDVEFVEVLAFRQESEIEAAQWMSIKEMAEQPFAQKHELLRYMINVGLAKAEKSYNGFSPRRIKSSFSNRQSYLYLNDKSLDQPSRSDDSSEDS